ncbi:MAG: hypothetical protein JWO03_3456 [Bacteroidetes bacterium]|nr:hypothetical protein [Bacteroidota bacterium]
MGISGGISITIRNVELLPTSEVDLRSLITTNISEAILERVQQLQALNAKGAAAIPASKAADVVLNDRGVEVGISVGVHF